VGGEILGWLTRTAKKDGRVAVCGNAAGTKPETTVFPFILRGVDLLGIDSDWCASGPGASSGNGWRGAATFTHCTSTR
jgi:NADPH:quinone reductase-like Zn-dependent oxidoreductase